MPAIKQEILDRIKKSVKAKAMLSYEFNKHTATIERWLESNDATLTTPAAIKVITEELGLTKAEILAA